jgi:hypothetical protein
MMRYDDAEQTTMDVTAQKVLFGSGTGFQMSYFAPMSHSPPEQENPAILSIQ